MLGTASIGVFTVGVAASSEFLSQLKLQQQSTLSVGFQQTLSRVRIGLTGLVSVPIIAFTGAAILDWQPYLVYSLGLVGYAGWRFKTVVLPLLERQGHSSENDKGVVIEERAASPTPNKEEEEDISASGLTESVYNIEKRDYEDTEDEIETEAKEVLTGEDAEPIADGITTEKYDSKSDELELREFRKQRLIVTLLSGASFLIALVGVAGERK
ncbi:hypothetical protein D0Z03_000693 [Geotrichum reessii]|nr:hypothetical protein D0Z03_000693 [Galactomyces reessii]